MPQFHPYRRQRPTEHVELGPPHYISAVHRGARACIRNRVSGLQSTATQPVTDLSSKCTCTSLTHVFSHQAGAPLKPRTPCRSKTKLSGWSSSILRAGSGSFQTRPELLCLSVPVCPSQYSNLRPRTGGLATVCQLLPPRCWGCG